VTGGVFISLTPGKLDMPMSTYTPKPSLAPDILPVIRAFAFLIYHAYFIVNFKF
jgi:hypothetical protein